MAEEVYMDIPAVEQMADAFGTFGDVHILIELGHPAHPYFFKGAMRILRAEGHQITLVTRDKPLVNALPYMRTQWGRVSHRSRNPGTLAPVSPKCFFKFSRLLHNNSKPLATH